MTIQPTHAKPIVLLFALLVASSAVGQPAADPYAEVLGYKLGQPRTAVMAIEAEIARRVPPNCRPSRTSC